MVILWIFIILFRVWVSSALRGSQIFFCCKKIRDLSKNISQRNPQLSYRKPETHIISTFMVLIQWFCPNSIILWIFIYVFRVWVSGALRDLRYFSVAKKSETCQKIFPREIPSVFTEKSKITKISIFWL